MEKDPVCGMQVDPQKAVGTSEHQGKTYYFCSRAGLDASNSVTSRLSPALAARGRSKSFQAAR
jgi:hypothetical protein